MMSNLERLAYMANQIARNFSALGEEGATRATADHIATYWDPRMRQQGFDLLDGERHLLKSVAASALCQLRDRGAPPQLQRRGGAEGGRLFGCCTDSDAREQELQACQKLVTDFEEETRLGRGGILAGQLSQRERPD